MSIQENDFLIGGYAVRISQVHDNLWASFESENDGWVTLPLPETITSVPETLEEHEEDFFLAEIEGTLKDLIPG